MCLKRQGSLTDSPRGLNRAEWTQSSLRVVPEDTEIAALPSALAGARPGQLWAHTVGSWEAPPGRENQTFTINSCIRSHLCRNPSG